MRLNITGGRWDSLPADLVGGWTLVESDSASLLSTTSTDTFNYGGGGGTSRARASSARSAASLEDDSSSSFTAYSRGKDGRPALTLLANGDVQLAADTDCTGLSWRLEPGPTHLDTCYVLIEAPRGSFSTGKEEGRETVTFMGYIDRGQRIESRFSKRLIRMSGLVVTSEASTEFGKEFSSSTGTVTSRFVMEKTRPL